MPPRHASLCNEWVLLKEHYQERSINGHILREAKKKCNREKSFKYDCQYCGKRHRNPGARNLHEDECSKNEHKAK